MEAETRLDVVLIPTPCHKSKLGPKVGQKREQGEECLSLPLISVLRETDRSNGFSDFLRVCITYN